MSTTLAISVAAFFTGAVSCLIVTPIGAARRSPLPTWLLAVPPLLWAVAIGAIVVGVTRGRALMTAVDLLGGGDPSAKATALGEGTSAQIDLLPWLSAVVTWIPLLFGVAAVVLVAVRGTRAKRPIAPGILVAVAVTVPVSLAGTALGAWCMPITTIWGSLAGVDPADKPRLTAEAFTAAANDLARGRLALAIALGLAAALAIAAAALAARRGAIVSSRTSAVVATLFACAVAAFMATRGIAYDARHPLEPFEGTGLLGGKTIERVPRVDRCGETRQFAPLIDAGDGLALNGRRVTPAELRDELITLRNNHKLLHPDDSSPSSVVLLAPAERQAAELAPIMAAAHEAGCASVQAAVIVPHDVETRTLGRLARWSNCRRTIALDRPFAPPAGASWADFLVHDAL